MSKKRLFKILLPTLALTFGSQAVAYTVQEAVSNTLATSPDFLISTNIRDKVDKELRGSYANYLPTVDLTAGIGQQDSNTITTRGVTGTDGSRTKTRTEFGISASQMLFDGFAVYHDVEGNKARVKAESWRVNGSAQETALSAVDAYLEVLLRRELVRVAKINLENHQKIYNQIQKRSEGGIGRKADLDQAEGRLALAKTNLYAEEGNLQDANTEFLRRVGISTPQHLTPVEMPTLPPSLDQAVTFGISHHPILRASMEDTEVTRQEHRGARAPFSPRFDLFLDMTRNHNIDGTRGDSDSNAAMLRLRWNIFSGGKDLARICETAYHMQEAQEVQNRAQRQVVESVKLSWSTYLTAKRSIPSLRMHVDASARTRDAYQKQFNIGQRTLLDLLDIENELFASRVAYESGKRDELFGAYRVLNAMGVLTDYMGVILPRQAEPRPTGLMDGAFRFFKKDDTTFDKPNIVQSLVNPVA